MTTHARTTWSLLFAAGLLLPSVAWAQDTDGDGLSDAEETNVYMTNAMSVDTDGDGLSDSDEVFNRQTLPTMKDSDGGGVDDFTEILSGTDPNVAGDDATGTANGPGATSTWVFSTVTMDSIASSDVRFQEVIPNDFRSFISTAPINYSDQTGNHGPFNTNRTAIQDVWGADPTYYVWTFSGHLVVPPATQANPDNKHTIAASTDDGFRLRVHDGTAVRSAVFDSNRAVATGPLLTVDFPDEGGVFAFELLTWEQGGAATSQLSWAPGEVTAFSTSTFGLIPATRMVGPDLTALQTLVDVNGGQVVAGDTLEATVNITNRGQATAYNLRFLPNRRSNVTFSNFVTTPANATVVADGVNIPLLNPGQTVTVVYRATADAATNYSVQGEVLADTSAIATVGTQRVRVLTDDPNNTSNTDDIGNRPEDLYADGATDDDPNLFTALADLSPPAVQIDAPDDDSDLNTSPVVVSGTTEVGATVQIDVVDDSGANVFSGPAAVDMLGNWSVDVPGLTDGDYTVTATATDAAGNAATDDHDFSLDRVAPAVSVTAPVDGSVTDDTTPTLTGTTEPNTDVVITLQGPNNTTQTFNVTSDAGGDFSVTPAALADGEYEFSAVATDDAGNDSPASNVNEFTVDTPAPVVTLSTPAAGSSTDDTTPTISGTTEPNAAVEITLTDDAGNTQTINTTADAQGDFSVDAPTLAEADYDVSAQATDAAGNTGNSPTNTFTVDTTEPTVAITAPADGSTTSDTTPTITGTTEPNAAVEITLTDSAGNAQVFNVTAGASGDFDVTALGLADDTYTISAEATDAAGNTGSTANDTTFTVATTSSLTLDTPADGTVTSDDTPTLSGTTDPMAVVTLVITGVNGTVGTQTITVTADVNGDYDVDAQALGDGTYEVRASAVNPSGGVGQAGPNAFTIDSTDPTLTLATPANGSAVSDSTPTLSGTTEPNATVVITLTDDAGNAQTVTAIADTNGAYSVDAPTLADGDYTVTAEATDAAGNTSPIAGPNAFTVDTQAPAVTLDAPADGLVSANNVLTATGTTEVGATVEVIVRDDAGVEVQRVPAMVDAQGDYTADTGQLSDGTYTVEVVATDAAGNTATAGPNTVVVDTAAPALTLDSPADGSSTEDLPEIEGTTEDNATVTLTILDDQGNLVETITVQADGDGDYEATPMSLAEGTYTITATTTDAAGNTATAGPNTFIVDTTNPTIAITAPADGSTISEKRPDISGTTEPGATVEVTLRDGQGNEVFTQTVTADAATGVFTVPGPSMDLADDTYTVDAQATDAAGNTDDTITTFVINSSALPLTIDAPAQGSSVSNDTPDILGTTAPSTMVNIVLSDANGVPVGLPLTATSDAQGDYITTPAMALADGEYTVTATVISAGGVVTTQTSTFTVDTVDPTLTLDAPADADETSDDTPTLSGTTEPGATVTLVLTDDQGMEVETLVVVADPQGAYSVDAAQLPEGTYTVTADAVDGAGNASPTVGPVGFTVDVTAPVVDITAPTTDEIVATREVPLAGTSDPNQDVLVEVTNDMGVVVFTATATADAAGMWNLNSDALVNGDYTVTATARDGADNVGTDSEPFSVDSSEALLTVTAPLDGDATSQVRPAVTGVADPDAQVTVTFTNDQGDVVETVTATVNPDGTYSAAPTADLPEGDYTIDVNATRPNGTMADAQVGLSVDTTTPDVAITAPAQDATVSPRPTITGTTEPGANVDVVVTDDQGTVVFQEVVQADAQGDFSVTPATDLPDGDYTADATATDAAGNTADADTVDFTVNQDVPSVTIDAPAPNADVADTTPTISGQAPAGSTVEVFVDGVSVGTTTTDAQGQWTLDVPEDQALAPGAHEVEAKVEVNGVEGTSGVIEFNVVPASGDLTIDAPTSGSTVQGPDVTVSGKGTPGETVTVTIGGQTQTATVDDQGNWSATVTGVPDGDATITATSGADSVSVDVTVGPEVTNDDAVILAGGGCSSTSQGGPLNTLGLALLVMGGLVFWRRRR